jgi:TonB family protein
MKFCPTCKTLYDEEILRFCTRDGTPLVEEGEPNFTALPSEADQDDLGEETVIRRKTPPAVPRAPDPESESERISSPRIVIPMTGEAESESPPPRRPTVRTAAAESIRHQPPSRKSNTATIVFLTVLGTVAVLAGAAGVFWFLNNQNSNANQKVNYNTNFNSIDINLNTNLNVGNSLANFDYNSNVNANANPNANANANINTNLKTPTPTKTPTATPTPETNVNANGAINTNINANSNALPTNTSPTSPPRPLPSASPVVSPTPPSPAVNRPVNAGILNGRAVSLPKPAYPPLAKQMRAVGQVAVQVLVDDTGNVTSARATSGNPMLRASAEAAARQSKFNPVRVNNQPVPASGIVLYNFTNQ